MIGIRKGRAQPPKVLPLGWSLVEVRDDGFLIQNRAKNHSIIVSCEEHDGAKWMHLSMAIPGERVPTWDELVHAKEWLLGSNVWAYQVIPSREEYVNINPYVLHLFCLADGSPALPMFTRGGRTL